MKKLPAHIEALAYMGEKRNKNTVPDFKYTVKVQHQDGSFFLFENAFEEEKKFGEYDMLLVYTEHCGYHAFYVGDLEHWRVLEYKKNE